MLWCHFCSWGVSLIPFFQAPLHRNELPWNNMIRTPGWICCSLTVGKHAWVETNTLRSAKGRPHEMLLRGSGTQTVLGWKQTGHSDVMESRRRDKGAGEAAFRPGEKLGLPLAQTRSRPPSRRSRARWRTECGPDAAGWRSEGKSRRKAWRKRHIRPGGSSSRLQGSLLIPKANPQSKEGQRSGLGGAAPLKRNTLFDVTKTSAILVKTYYWVTKFSFAVLFKK